MGVGYIWWTSVNLKFASSFLIQITKFSMRMDSLSIKVVFLLLIPILIFGQLDRESAINPTEPIGARLALDKLEKLRNLWKALCDQLCPQAIITSFILPSRLFCTTKCNRRPSTKSTSESRTTSTSIPTATKMIESEKWSSSEPGSANPTGVSGSSAVPSSAPQGKGSVHMDP